MATRDELLDDLAAEHDALDGRLAPLADADWLRATPAEGWSIADSVSHLAYFDRSAHLALTEPDRFAEHLQALAAAGGAPDVEMGRTEGPETLLAEWRRGRADLVDAAAAADPNSRVPWYGPPMGLLSFLTARLMETWAHGVDCTDALGLAPEQSPRLRHVVDIGVRARPYAFRVHGVDDPGTPVAVIATDEEVAVAWGDPSTNDRIEGSMVGLALVFTQRRHPSDVGVTAHGPVAAQWLAIAQAFAGPAGPGRSPSGSA